MRPAIAHRHAKPLHRADGDVGVHLAGRLEERERQRISRDNGEGLGRVQFGYEVGVVVKGTFDARVLEQRPEDLLRFQVLEGVADDDLPAERFRACLQHGDRLGQALRIDEEGVLLRLGDPVCKRHRLGGCCRFVE